jgi:hypothetical protein
LCYFCHFDDRRLERSELVKQIAFVAFVM